MPESLKSKTLRGAFWTLLERLGTQLIGFCVTLCLARLLTPGDYGVIGMITVFISVSQMFIDCGFGSALIRKKDRTDEDFSTVFWFNLIIAIFCYLILFVAAPYVAMYYRMGALRAILRVLGLNLIVNALYTIQVTRLTALIQFKLQAKIAVATCVITGCVGVSLAACGFGPWALVGQMLTHSLIAGGLYWGLSGWRPQFIFSFRAFRELFGFGSKLVAASLLNTIYANVAPLIIGRKYSAADLGLYSRADGLAALPGGIFQGTLGRVVFPVLASIQDDEIRLRKSYNKYLRLTTSIVAPSMLLLAACAQPLISVLIGSKWLPCVPYLQLLAIGWMIDPIIVVNLNILYVKGRSDVVLKLEIIKKIIAIAIVVVSVQYGVFWLCVGRVVYGYIALVLNLHYCGPFIGMSFWRQMREVSSVYLAAFVSAILAYQVSCVGIGEYMCNFPFMSSLVTLLSAGLVGIGVYCALACWLHFDLIDECLLVLRRLRERFERR